MPGPMAHNPNFYDFAHHVFHSTVVTAFQLVFWKVTGSIPVGGSESFSQKFLEFSYFYLFLCLSHIIRFVMEGTLECLHNVGRLFLQICCHSSFLHDAGPVAHNPSLYDFAHHESSMIAQW